MAVIVKKQSEILISECESGDLAIESDVLLIGKQVIYVTPENAISLGHALIKLAKESIRLSDFADKENQENS